MTAILHTWGQNLSQHLHLHCVVIGGALTADRAHWVAAKPGFLFPVRALSPVFRAKYLHALRAAFERGALTFAAGTADLADPVTFARFLAALRTQPWVVYAKPPFGGPAQVLAYLGRYTHRVALSNARLLDLRDGIVRFRWRDYADRDRVKVMVLTADEFLRRFLLHVVPRGFMRIRHFGLLANRQRRALIARCRAVLAAPAPDAPAASPTKNVVVHCPVCRVGVMHVTAALAPGARIGRPGPDTS